MIKSCETLSFLVRDAAHVTQENFEFCIHCIRTFIEATVTQQPTEQKNKGPTINRHNKNIRKATSTNSISNNDQNNDPQSTFSSGQITHLTKQSKLDYDDEDDQEAIKQEYQALALQLLDLMHTLHTRASQIHKQMTEGQTDQITSNLLWNKCWCPILQGIARLCCDPRRPVRSAALGYLQRSVLLPELHILSPIEWESVFNKVLFPLLLKLLETINVPDYISGIEETRVRVSQLLCRIFLQHLSPLLTLPTFTALWLTILDFMDRYLKSDQTDMLRESVRESLKNMILVMNTTGLFETDQSLTMITKDRIHCILPGLWQEVFKMTAASTSEVISLFYSSNFKK